LGKKVEPGARWHIVDAQKPENGARGKRDVRDSLGHLRPVSPLKKAASEGFIPPHGGYQKLLAYQKALVVYDATVYFCDRFIDKRSRTHDQMIQAARSGKQNILEGSEASGTSKETEIKLTGVAQASQKELLEDYRDFLRSRGIEEWAPDHPYSPSAAPAQPHARRKLSDLQKKHRTSRSGDLRQRHYRFDQGDRLPARPAIAAARTGFSPSRRLARAHDPRPPRAEG
jgi:hypothetical protein